MLFSNPLVYAALVSRGGAKGHLTVGGATLLALVVIDLAVIQLGGENWRRGLQTWNTLLLVIQSVLLLGITFPPVSNAVRNDAKSGMHDSLRLMRFSPAGVVRGYLLGGCLQGMAVFVPCALVGLVNTVLVGGDTMRYSYVTLTMLLTLPLTLTAAAFAALVFRVPAIAFVVLGFVGPFGFAAASTCPPMALLAAPLFGPRSILTGSVTAEPVVMLALLAHVAIAALLFIGTTRKFRNPLEPAFDPPLGLVIVVLTSVASFFALMAWDLVAPSWSSDPDNGRIVGTLVLQQIVTLLPVLTAARLAGRADIRRTLGGPAKADRGGGKFWIVILIAAAVPTAGAFVDSFAIGRVDWKLPRLAMTFGQLLVYLAGIGVAHRFATAKFGKPALLVGVLLPVWLFLPFPVAAAVPAGPSGQPGQLADLITAISPIGLMVETWTSHDLINRWPPLAQAIAIQAGVVGVLTLVLRLWSGSAPPAATGVTVVSPAESPSPLPSKSPSA